MVKPRTMQASLIFVLACAMILGFQFSPLVYGQQSGLSNTSPQPADANTGQVPLTGNVALPVVTDPVRDSAPVVDSVAPWISQPLDVFLPAYDASGALVSFALPAVGDDSGGPVNLTCDWGTGALFPLGTSVVTCSARDSAGNGAQVSFRVTVTDQSPPVINVPADIVVNAVDPTGAIVSYASPGAWDNVNGAVPVGCDHGSGVLFPVGVTLVTCSSVDQAGNWATPVAFHVTVVPPVVPTIAPPAPTQVPAVAPTPIQTVIPDPVPTESVEVTETVLPSEPTEVVTVEPVDERTPVPPTPGPTPALKNDPAASASSTPVPTSTPASTVTAAPTAGLQEPAPAGLDLPWPPPGQFLINAYGGPLNGIDMIWGYGDYPISQEFGHTEFSIRHSAWYAYGLSYGLDGFQHPGLDVAMPAGTWLYSPVDGTVQVSGNSPSYTYYGNGSANVGHLLIVTDDGHEVILGHMGAISVGVGERVEVGQFVGLSGGFNGDHLHLEVREIQAGGWFRALDPRQSFMVHVLEEAAKPVETQVTGDAVLPPAENRWTTSSRRRLGSSGCM